VARARALHGTFADERTNLLLVFETVMLWLLRLVPEPRSTLTGFRQWVADEIPVALGRHVIRDKEPKALESPAARPEAAAPSPAIEAPSGVWDRGGPNPTPRRPGSSSWSSSG
jgi:hypothetical protein